MFRKTRSIAAPALGPIAPASALPAGRARGLVRRLLVSAASLVAAAVAFAAYEHLRLEGASTEATAALVAAAALAMSPVRWVVHELFAIEGALLHLVHGVGGLVVMGLTFGGVFSGRPVLDHAALAPFAMMGAAQSLMHQPRNAEQAVALRRFVTGISSLQTLTRSGTLDSAANARRSVAILSGLVADAQSLGETELRSDPAARNALQRTLLRTGVSLELDSVDEALGRLAENPAAASSAAELRKRLAAARRTLER